MNIFLYIICPIILVIGLIFLFFDGLGGNNGKKSGPDD